MKKCFSLLYFFLVLGAQSSFGQDTFKTMFYNVLNYPLDEPASRIQGLELIIGDYQPDIFMICELNNEQGADDILNIIKEVNLNYKRANFVLNTSDDNTGNSNELQNMLYYDSNKFQLEAQREVTTIYRDFNHYILKLKTTDQDTNPIRLNVFVCHLKASDGFDNENRRKQMVDDFISYLDDLPSDSYILLAGDMNLYSSAEPAFQELIKASNYITFEDPADKIGSWHNNTSYLDVFTQSTRTQSFSGGATGGFDDRFDFILTSESLNNNEELKFVENSYVVYGNNKNINCYNSEINSSNCSGTLYNSEIRNALYFLSDHLPVTLEFQTNATLSVKSNIINTDTFTFLNGNIVSNTLSLKFKSTYNNLVLFIYNGLGQRLLKIDVNNAIMHQDVSHLSKGIYYITTSYNRQPLKFIKK